MDKQRLQKLLAHAGFGSRREIDRLLHDGKISVNGKIAKPGDKADRNDNIKINNMLVKFSKADFQTQVLLYHKKVGEHVTRDPEVAAKSVFSKLPSCKHGRWISVGRLDVNTSGLLLFTNDGELAHRLMHPSYQIDREYAVRVLGDINDDTLTTLLTGVTLEDGEAKFLDVQQAGGRGVNQWFHVLLQEGRKRVVRRLWESQGCQVSRLMRVRFGTVFLDNKTRAGRHRLLDKADLQSLYSSVNLKINH